MDKRELNRQQKYDAYERSGSQEAIDRLKEKPYLQQYTKKLEQIKAQGRVKH